MTNDPKRDFKLGIALKELQEDGILAGRVGEEDAILIRRGEQFYAVGALCTHYHGHLADGLVVGETIRCPLHHACFNLKTGAVIGAPALDPVPCWQVERNGDRVFVGEPLTSAPPAPASRSGGAIPRSVVIVGGGAAALAAAATLRREGYENALTLISADDTAPYDRPNLSKDFLAGTAPEEWMPLRAANFYADNHIDLMLNTSVGKLDPLKKQVTLTSGKELSFDALLLCTGSQATAIAIPGATRDNLYYLRTLADSRLILKRLSGARRAVIRGAGFIGLEAAAALRTQGLEVHVVSPQRVPMERVFGAQIGTMLLELHASHGVTFHAGTNLTGISGRTVSLSDGSTIEADFVLAGVGAQPCLDLARGAGLSIDGGVVVDEYLHTNAPGVFAAGDIARYPAHFSGSRIRVEHWVAAERQGETAARNILGRREVFRTVPFFWTQHYDVAVNYTGHADSWDSITVDGDVAQRNCAVSYLRGKRAIAMATVGRDLENLKAELMLEKRT
jgi:NADPH-dependent 2,4-dienoyl-CoA reductase/sulfur reductase-like enzyme/nitrite reductase/ring-hydroxylating ferredoxin subunit